MFVAKGLHYGAKMGRNLVYNEPLLKFRAVFPDIHDDFAVYTVD